jgi:hypothetical protein
MEIPFHDGADQRGDFNNIGPRIGFAWDPTESGRMVVKGGYGLFYDNIRTLLSMLGERTWHQAQQIIIANPGYPDPLGGRSREEFLSTAPPNIEVMANDFENPYAHQYNLGASRQLSSDFALSVDFTYVRRYADLNNPNVNINYPVNGVRPYPQFGRVQEDRSAQENRYKGFFVKLDKRLSDRYQYLVSYTWSDSEDRQFRNDDLTTTGFVMSDWYPALADRRHRLVASGIVQLPYDIQLSAIMDLRSSLPFEVNTGTDVNRDTYTNDLAPGTAFRSGCRDLNLDAANAYLASIGAGGVSEGDIECPGFANVDLRGSKFFNLPGGQRFELIVQALNLLNRANFNVPIGNLRSSSFGAVTDILPNINAPSRQVEFAIRFAF